MGPEEPIAVDHKPKPRTVVRIDSYEKDDMLDVAGTKVDKEITIVVKGKVISVRSDKMGDSLEIEASHIKCGKPKGEDDDYEDYKKMRRGESE